MVTQVAVEELFGNIARRATLLFELHSEDCGGVAHVALRGARQSHLGCIGRATTEWRMLYLDRDSIIWVVSGGLQ